MMNVKIQQIMVEHDVLQIGYFVPGQDTKAGGIIQAHTLVVPRGGDYDDEIAAVEDALVYLVNDVLDDWDKLSPEADDDE